MLTRKSFCIALALLFIHHLSVAQLTVKGCIYNAADSSAIPWVSISDNGGDILDISDDNGCFSIVVPQLPCDLIIERIGFIKRRIRIADTGPHRFTLQSENYVLNPVTIAGKEEERVAGNERYSIWDYAWLDDQLLICDYTLSLASARLVWLNALGDTLAFMTCPGRPTGLFNDCGGAAYVLSRDSLWQVYAEQDKLLVYEAESAELVDRVLRYCVGQNTEAIYFAIPRGAELRMGDDTYAFRYTTNNTRMEYFRFDRATEVMQKMYEVLDEFTLALQRDEIMYGDGPQPSRRVESGFSKAVSKAFFWRVMCKEVDAPMYVVNDSLYILDHIAGEMIVLNQLGSEIRRGAIEYHLANDYQRMSLLDPLQQQLYAVFENKGFYSVAAIDLRSGIIGKRYGIPHAFPEHISIRNGYVYYLTRDEKTRDARVLNRIRLEP